MTARSRALSWFVAPPATHAPAPPAPPSWRPPSSSHTVTAPLAPPSSQVATAWPAPAPATVTAPPALAPAPATVTAPPALAPAPSQLVDAPTHPAAAPGALVADAVVTSAAVLGRAGEVEPVAASLALALRRRIRAKAATVAVVGVAPPVDAGGGGAAARRVVARLDAHGFEAQVRGRLAWVRLDPADPEFAAAARRVTLIAAPAVFAITAPRTSALDEALAEQDLLVIVTGDPGGPLAQLAASGLPPVPVLALPPLPRGPRRALARAGVRAPRRLAREVAR